MIFLLILKFSCPLNYRSKECRKLLESFKKSELKSLGSQAQDSQYKNFPKKWLDLIADSVFAKINKKSDNEIKERSKYIITIHFGNNGMT